MCAEGRVALEPRTGGRILPGPRVRAVLPAARRPHVRRPDSRVRAGQKGLRRRMAAADRTRGRVLRQTMFPRQPARGVRHGIDRGTGGERVPRQRLAGRGQTGNSILLPEQ